MSDDPADDVLLDLRDIGLTYSGATPVVALGGCSLSVRAGEYLALVGPSGSGKSSLLNVIGLLERPTAGTYAVRGRDVGTANERVRARLRAADIGFVFQAFHLLPSRTALENVELAAAIQRRPRAERTPVARAALHRVGLGHRQDARAATLSGGERQRVALARALMGDPPLLLCDEPTGNLDSRSTTQILDLLDEQHARGATLIVVTHEADVAARARRVVEVDDGVIASDGPPS